MKKTETALSQEGMKKSFLRASLSFYEGRRADLRRLAVVLILLAAALLCQGCVKKYTAGEIKSYASKEAGHNDLTVPNEYREILEDEEGYLDHLWTVTDNTDGIVFHVLDDYYWAMEEVENRLLNDYDSCVFLSLFERGKLPGTDRISFTRTDNSGLIKVDLYCSFTDRASLNDCYEDLCAVREAAEKAGYPGLDVNYHVCYESVLRRAVDYETGEGNTEGNLGSIDKEALKKMTNNYLACVLDYRFENALSEFSPEEIDTLVNLPGTVRIYKAVGGDSDASPAAADPSQREYYDGVIGNPRYAGISFGTLYEILKKEGFKPSGNAWHFSFRGPEGNLYEMSYDFNDLSGYNDKQGKLRKGYYYIRDDRKVRMSSYYANHFEASEINALTGLRIAEDRPYLTTDEKGAEQ